MAECRFFDTGTKHVDGNLWSFGKDGEGLLVLL